MDIKKKEKEDKRVNTLRRSRNHDNEVYGSDNYNGNYSDDYNMNDVNETNDTTSQRLNKLDILILNKGWNDKNEKLIVSIGYNSGIYKQLHDQAHKRYIFYNKILSLLLILLSAVLSTNSIADFFNDFDIVRKILAFALTILTVINNFLNFGEIAQDHIHSASLFNTIYNDIRNMMCVYRKDRYTAVKYIQSIIKQYDQLELKSPVIPGSLISKMEKRIKSDSMLQYHNITLPQSQFHEIEVLVDNPQPGDVENANKERNNNFKINNMQNIHQIHNCFKIDGELSENDNITMNDIQQQSKKHGLNLQTQYEMRRFMRDDDII